MEKKKLLLVAVSVGVVLLIVIGFPLLVISPRQNAPSLQSTSLAERNQNRILTVDPVDVPIDNQAPVDIAQQDEIVPVAPQEETPHVTTITVSPPPETVAVPTTPVVEQAQKPVVAKVEPAKPVTPAAPKEPAKPPVAASPPVVVKAPAVVKQPPVTVKPPAPKAPVAQPSTAKAEPAKTYNNYWVQTGAFSTQIRAEGAKEQLASKGIASIIDNRDIDGKTWYRVRVGPYMSETEASYWLALVKSIDGFTGSQIRQSQAMR
jgi:DedD protein